MESGQVPPQATTESDEWAPGNKGLKKNAIGYVSNVVIGVASTAPGYSLAAVLAFVVIAGGGAKAIESGGSVGLQSPAILLIAFIPMFFIAAAYYYMNKADPDCGTTFAWVTRAMGPHLGWIGGWAIIVADIIVMANLAQIAGLYTFLLFDADSLADSTFWVTFAGVIWIVIMTTIVTIGIELSARTQVGLLGAEILTLFAFVVVALVKVYVDGVPGSQHIDISWFSPFAIDSLSTVTAGVLIAVFIYWGWDSAVTVNEESENSDEGPGKSALVSTVILLLIYVGVAAAAQAVSFDLIIKPGNRDDVLSALGSEVFGSPWDKLIIIAVLTSAAASTQTTILPTARTTLSMARAHALPGSLGKVHPRFLTPHISTILMGIASIGWYVGLTIISENILFDSIAALGLMIAFYYGLTGFACAIYYRHELTKSVKNFLYVGVAPVRGAGVQL
jgi:amino acid transporter